MTDTALRELERRWRATEDPADEARVLAERLRSGRLPPARLELAAYLGHGPARAALGDGAPAGDFVPWARWRRALDAPGRAALLLGALVQLDLARAVAEERHAGLAEALRAVEAWCACPCGEHARAVEQAEPPETLGHPAYDAAGLDEPTGGEPTLLRAASLLRAVCRAAGERADAVLGEDPLGLLMRGLLGAARRRGPVGLGLEPLVRWALGAAHALTPAPARDDLEAEARWLLERVARGDLARDAVTLAAYALAPAARAALVIQGDGGAEGQEAAAPEVTAPDAWVAGLARWGAGWAPRAAAWYVVEAVDPWTEWGHLLERTAEEGGDVFVHGTRALLEAGDAVRRWADAPADDARRALEAHADALAALAADPRVAQVRAALAAGGPTTSALALLEEAIRLACAGEGDPVDLVRRAAVPCPDAAERLASLRREVAWWALRPAEEAR
ncbi:MAG: hypothetical protein M9894_08205 [Planctomycetes bacterium]|nr:hypothetical protein [Planctomycetota bacterium]